MNRWLRWAPALVGPLLLSCCTAPRCAPENLPYGGRPTTPAELFAIVQHASGADCCGTLYANLSQPTREEFNEWSFCAFWEEFDLPEPYEEYELGEVVREGTFVGTFPGPEEGEEFVLVEYDRDGPDGPLPNLLAKILTRKEPPEDGGLPEPRVGLQEQIDAIDAGKFEYYWDAGW